MMTARLDEGRAAAGGEHARELGEDRLLVRDVMESIETCDAIERRVGERETIAVVRRVLERNIRIQLRRCGGRGTREFDGRLRHVDSRGPHTQLVDDARE